MKLISLFSLAFSILLTTNHCVFSMEKANMPNETLPKGKIACGDAKNSKFSFSSIDTSYQPKKMSSEDEAFWKHAQEWNIAMENVSKCFEEYIIANGNLINARNELKATDAYKARLRNNFISDNYSSADTCDELQLNDELSMHPLYVKCEGCYNDFLLSSEKLAQAMQSAKKSKSK